MMDLLKSSSLSTLLFEHTYIHFLGKTAYYELTLKFEIV